MKSFLPAWRRRTRAAAATVAAVLAAATLLVMPAAHAADPVPPALTDGFGLTQVAPATGTADNFVLTVTTAQVAGPHHIRVILPVGYADNPTKRYPVFYLLHGTSDDPGNPGLAFPALTASSAMITVIPDGGLRGWYADWLDQSTAAGAQHWETFHLTQVIPFIDANLRTIATKQGRGIGGISMGGLGALRYSQDRPDLFSQVATFSGADDISGDEAVVRAAVVGTLTNVGGLCGNASDPNCPFNFGPTVSSDAVFGSPYPVFNADWRWNEADPSTHMDKLAGMGISLYVGNGQGNGPNTAEEFLAESATLHVRDHLDALGMPYYLVDYGNGATWGTNCGGGHNGYCWAQDLVDYVPRLEQAFASS